MCNVLQIHKLCLEDKGDGKAKASASARQDADNRNLFSFAAL